MAVIITLVIIATFGIYAVYTVEKQKKYKSAH